MTVHFIGAGPGAADLITLRAQRLIATSPVCLYAGSLVPPEMLADCPPGARLIDTAELSLDQIEAELIAAHAAGHDVARLCSGDPSLFSAVAEQVERLRRAGIPYDITPGVPAYAAAAASLGQELTVPGIGQSVVLTRIAAQATPMPAGQDLASLAVTGATLVVHLAVHRIDAVVADLLPHYGPDVPVAVVAYASRSDEVIVRARLAEIAERVRAARVHRTAVIIVGAVLGAGEVDPIDCHSHLYSPSRGRKLIIRAAGPEDAGAVTELVRRAYDRYTERIGAEPGPMSDDYVPLIDAGQVWVGQFDSVVVGAVVLVERDDHLLLRSVAVDPSAQGRGHGRGLLAFAEARALERGYSEIRLYTHVRMSENIDYYARQGYRETHRGFDEGFERVFFSKPVPPTDPPAITPAG